MNKLHDLIIRWNDEKKTLKTIRRQGGIPLHGYPHHLRCPGGHIAVVGKDNQILLSFQAQIVEHPRKVTLADGTVKFRGFFIRAKKGTIHPLNRPCKAPIRGWHAIGQFRYFTASKIKSVVVGDDVEPPKEYQVRGSNRRERNEGIVFHVHTKGIPGMPRSQPEAQLVDEYVSWMGERARFGHNFIRAVHLFVDLFDVTHWQLIEAKASCDRESLRMAIGQLRDYKRFYSKRHPSLAVLLPQRPSACMINLLHDNHITVIWRNSPNRFTVRKWYTEAK